MTIFSNNISLNSRLLIIYRWQFYAYITDLPLATQRLLPAKLSSISNVRRSIQCRFLHFPVLHFPPLHIGPAISNSAFSIPAVWCRIFRSRPAFSTPAYWCRISQSCIFHPCSLVPHFQVSHFHFSASPIGSLILRCNARVCLLYTSPSPRD